MTFRIGSVPYLNVKPLVDWFHSADCTADANVTYAVPSKLARMLQTDSLDCANVSIFEALQNPGLIILPGISISADGPVKSVRLFSRVPFEQIRTVALDTSSLTSAALTRIILKDSFHITPEYIPHAPDLDVMLRQYDAGLIIGDLKLFELPENTHVLDLGRAWKELTGLPFVYAAWLAREDRMSTELFATLERARDWGCSRLEELADKWAREMNLPLDRSREYLMQIMDYRLTPEQICGLKTYQERCIHHDLIATASPLRFFEL